MGRLTPEAPIALEQFVHGWATVILAAGGSTRMGPAGHKHTRPGPLGQTLPARAVETATAAGVPAHRVWVVLGAEAAAVRDRLPGACRTVFNPSWEAGPGGSVAVGVEAAHHTCSGDLRGVLVLLADQPLITPQDLRTLARAAAYSEAGLAAASFDSVLGAPAAFLARHVPDLLGLRDRPARGAATLIRGRAGVAAVPMPHARVDLDRPADWARWTPPPG